MVGASRPVAVILEESDRLVTYQSGRWWASRVDQLRAWGYEVHWAVLDAKEHGVPQNRARLWMVAIRRDAPCIGERFVMPEPHPT